MARNSGPLPSSTSRMAGMLRRDRSRTRATRRTAGRYAGMRTAYWTGCSGGIAAASQAGPELLLLRCGKARLRARHREKRSAGVYAQGRIEALLLGALQCGPGSLHVDFFGTLGAIGEHPDVVFEHLHKTSVDGEIPLPAIRHSHIGEGADTEQPQQRGVARQDPHVSVLAGDLPLPDQFAH